MIPPSLVEQPEAKKKKKKSEEARKMQIIGYTKRSVVFFIIVY